MLPVDAAGSHQLVNPYDPSMGYVEDVDEEPPYDPWEDGADEVDLDSAQVLDIAALRARQAKG